MTRINSKKNKYVLTAIGFGIATIVQASAAPTANAIFTNVIVRFDRMKANTTTTGMICATPAVTGTETKVLFTLPTGYSPSATLANWSVSTTNNGWPTGATAWPSIATATNVTGQIVTFPSGDLTVGTQYCFNWSNANAVTTNATAANSKIGSLETQNSGSTTIDRSDYATATITDDQIQVTASVPPSFAFSLSANTDQLGTLDTASVKTSPTPRVATINTNAKNGWSVWASDSFTGIKSPSASNYTIASTTPGTNSTLSAGTEGYNTGITSSNGSGTGSITVATPFVGGATGKGGGLNTTLQTLASSNGPNAGSTLTVTNNVAINALTPAANDYSDTITVVGAGLF